jgi:hypothetical protein
MVQAPRDLMVRPEDKTSSSASWFELQISKIGRL